MQEQYQEVPNMISGKDLDYLTDMFHWNYQAYKETHNASNSIEDIEIKKLLDKGTNLFHDVMMKILQILNQGGNNE